MEPDSLNELSQKIARVREGDSDALADLLRTRFSDEQATSETTAPLRALLRSLAALSEDQRSAFRLLCLERRSLDSVAARMDRSGQAVRALCAQALVRLTNSLKK